MPCRHSRSATGRGPGDRSGQGGSRGSISTQRSSSTIHGRVLTQSQSGLTPLGELAVCGRPGRVKDRWKVFCLLSFVHRGVWVIFAGVWVYECCPAAFEVGGFCGDEVGGDGAVVLSGYALGGAFLHDVVH
jgi:hypothetical protein